jgi:probable metal-binding protein
MGFLHIHDVLDIIYGSDRIYTIEELEQEVLNKYGEDIRLTSCSENQFGISEMVDFMVSRDKIQLKDNRIYPIGESCGHQE